MPVLSSKVSDLTNHGLHMRCRLEYIFDDGRLEILGPFKVKNSLEAESKLLEYVSIAEKNMSVIDSAEAIKMSLRSSYKQASENQVTALWAFNGIVISEAHQAYSLINMLSDKLAVNTDNDLSVAWNMPMSDVQKLRARWTYLKSNESAIQTYKQIMSGF